MSVIPFDTDHGSANSGVKRESFRCRPPQAPDAPVMNRMRLAAPVSASQRAMQTGAPSRLQMRMRDRNINCMLALSESRAYDCALEILGAYKLTGNFSVDLEIVLKDLGVLDKVTYEIKPKSPPSDRRHVVFWPNDNVHMDRFSEIMRSLKKRIGFDATLPWWVRLFR